MAFTMIREARAQKITPHNGSEDQEGTSCLQLTLHLGQRDAFRHRALTTTDQVHVCKNGA